MKIRKKVLVLVLLFVGLIITGCSNIPNEIEDTYKIADGIVKINLKSDVEYYIDLKYAKVFNNYDDFSMFFETENITESDFENNNYAIIILNYDDCLYTNVIPTKYNINDNTINITVYHDGCSSCEISYAYFAVKVDKSITKMNQNINWNARDKSSCN